MLVFCDELKFPVNEIDILNKLLISAIQILVDHKSFSDYAINFGNGNLTFFR